MSTKRRLLMKKSAFSSKKLQQDSPESQCCRTCLSTENLSLIFTSNETEMRRSYDLKLVTGLEIKMNDGLSQKMCSKCTEAVNFMLQFRRVSRKAEKALLARASRTPRKVKKKYRIQKDTKTKLKSELGERESRPMDVEVDFSYDPYGEDYLDTYEYKDDVKTIIKQEASKILKKRSQRIPNASSYRCAHAGCGKLFRMKATYKAHIRFHTNFCVCESCGKRCRNNNQLQEHKRARHGLGRIHTCAYCEYSAATKEALTIHERRHTGERPYICDHCGATFHRRSNLVQHIAIHLPDKNFQCDMCPKRLKSKKFLQIHKHNAHTGKRYGYLCGVCAHRFEKPNKVRAHTRRVHGVPDDQQGPIARVQL